MPVDIGDIVVEQRDGVHGASECGDTAGGFAVSLSEFPIGLLDIYMRCNSSPTDRYVTSCPERYRIVESCDKSEDMIGAECVKLYEGTHKLVISAEVPDDKTCFTEELDRTPYGSAVADIALACDAFSPIDIAAAYRGDAPTELCCSKDQKTTLDFCLKPCGCRKLVAKIVPKEEAIAQNKINKKLKIAVFSNVFGHKKSFEKLVESIRSHGVDVVVSLGDLTSDGKKSEYTWFRNRFDKSFVYRDGQDAGNAACTTDDAGNICCRSVGDRLLATLCNAVFAKTPFIDDMASPAAYESAICVRHSASVGQGDPSARLGISHVCDLTFDKIPLNHSFVGALIEASAVSRTMISTFPITVDVFETPNIELYAVKSSRTS